jgi:hypothetical protein
VLCVMLMRRGTLTAATRLAQIASSMVSPPEETQPEESSMLGEIGRQVGLTARGAISGLTAIPGMVADAPVTRCQPVWG